MLFRSTVETDDLPEIPVKSNLVLYKSDLVGMIEAMKPSNQKIPAIQLLRAFCEGSAAKIYLSIGDAKSIVEDIWENVK